MTEWRKSSYSLTNTTCVEVAWQRSTYCSSNACVEVAWQKSSYCGTGACVEIGEHDGEVLMRDSKNPDVAPLHFSRAEWADFMQGVQAGEFE